VLRASKPILHRKKFHGKIKGAPEAPSTTSVSISNFILQFISDVVTNITFSGNHCLSMQCQLLTFIAAAI